MRQITHNIVRVQGRPRSFQVALVGSDCAGKNPAYFYRREKFDYTAVEYVQRGTMSVTLNGLTHTAQAGDVYLLQRGMRFEVRNASTADWQRTWFVLDGTLVEPILAALGLDRASVLRAGHMAAAFARLWELAAAQAPAATLSGVAFEILLRLSAQLQDTELALSPAVLRGKAYLDQQGLHPVDVDELGRIMGCTAAHAVRLFRKELGCTPNGYRRQQQMAQAKLLVAHTTKSMKTIAFELGFCDQYHFARVFKAALGVSPSSFRQSIRPGH